MSEAHSEVPSIMPAPGSRMGPVPESRAVVPFVEKPATSEKSETEHSARFLGTLLTPDLNPDAKVATFLAKPTTAYKAIDLLWAEKREHVPAVQLDEKVKAWADGRAEANIDMFGESSPASEQVKGAFKSAFGFQLDKSLPKDAQLQQFSDYLSGTYYKKFCGTDGIEKLAEVLSIESLASLHDFLTPLFGDGEIGELQFKRLQSTILAEAHAEGGRLHPEDMVTDNISPEESKLLDPMRQILLSKEIKEATVTTNAPDLEEIEADDQKELSLPLEDQPHLMLVKENDDTLPIQEVIEMKIGEGKFHVMHGDITHTPAEALVYQTNNQFKKLGSHLHYEAIREDIALGEAIDNDFFVQATQIVKARNLKSAGRNNIVPFGYSALISHPEQKATNGIQKVIFTNLESPYSGEWENINYAIFNNTKLPEENDTSEQAQQIWTLRQEEIRKIRETLIIPSLKAIYEIAHQNGIKSIGMPLLAYKFYSIPEFGYRQSIIAIGEAYRQYQQNHLANGEEPTVKDIYLVVDEPIDREHIDGSLEVMQDVAENLHKIEIANEQAPSTPTSDEQQTNS